MATSLSVPGISRSRNSPTVTSVPRRRQTLFFSATMPESIRQLASQFLHEPETVSVVPAATTAERVDQYVTFVNQTEKQALLTLVLQEGNGIC